MCIWPLRPEHTHTEHAFIEYGPHASHYHMFAVFLSINQLNRTNWITLYGIRCVIRQPNLSSSFTVFSVVWSAASVVFLFTLFTINLSDGCCCSPHTSKRFSISISHSWFCCVRFFDYQFTSQILDDAVSTGINAFPHSDSVRKTYAFLTLQTPWVLIPIRRNVIIKIDETRPASERREFLTILVIHHCFRS